MDQAAPQASGSSHMLAAAMTSQAGTRRKRFGGSKLSTWITTAMLLLLSGIFFLYLLVALIALLFHAPPSEIWEQMKQPDVLEALKLSFVTTAISTTLGVIFGLPAAILLARMSFPGVTQTLPIAVYTASQTNLDKSIAISVILLAVSFSKLPRSLSLI